MKAASEAPGTCPLSQLCGSVHEEPSPDPVQFTTAGANRCSRISRKSGKRRHQDVRRLVDLLADLLGVEDRREEKNDHLMGATSIQEVWVRRPCRSGTEHKDVISDSQ